MSEQRRRITVRIPEEELAAAQRYTHASAGDTIREALKLLADIQRARTEATADIPPQNASDQVMNSGEID
jgi:hypothetical protein